MRMTRWGAIPLGVLLLTLLVTLACSVQGRAVSSGHEHETSAAHVIRKRNAWWSKKSTDDSRRISSVQNNDIPERTSEDEVAIDCYAQTCVPEFVVCAAGRSQGHSRTTEFLQCKLRLRLCAKTCFEDERI